jgi:PAS domain S-box-containing protein
MKVNWLCPERSQRLGGIAAFLFYLTSIWIGVQYFDFLTNSFAIIPVVVVAWLCGTRAGSLMAIFTIIFGIILQYPVSGGIISTSSVGSLSLLVLALVIGLLSDGKRRIETELKEREDAQKELAVTEEWYRSIFDGVNDGVIVETPDGKVLDVNERACEIFGWSRKEFLTKNVEDMVPPEYYALLADNDTDLPDNEFETVNMRADGTYFPVSISGRLHQIGDEKRLLIIVRDITEKYMIENELKQNHQFLSHVIESLSHPFYVVNVEDYSIAIANSAARGVKAVDPNTTCYALTHDFDAPCGGKDHACPMVDVLRTKQAIRTEHVHRSSDGEIRNVEFYAHPIFDSRGQIVQIIESSYDITEQKRVLEQMEEAKNAAEAAAQAKADFLANMSHEIRTPLNAIYGMTSLMLNTPLNEEQQDFIETIRGGGETLLHVINDILDFSKIEAGKLELEEALFSVRDCVEESLDLLAEQAADKNLTLAYYIEDHVPVNVIGDITRLRQILVNLLNNGIKFTRTGEIVVNVSAEKIASDEEFEIQFSVRDTGIGIPKEKLVHLFESFTQVDTSTTRKYGGTGLGLAISSDLAEAMGGRMWVESEVGVGSVFHFTILAVAKPNAEPVIPEDDRKKLAKKVVLVASENSTIRTILVKQTENWNMVACSAQNEAQISRLINDGIQFDAVIVDANMLEANKYWEQPIPMILLVSINQQNHYENNPRVSVLLNKPIKQLNLFNTLTQALDSTALPRQKARKTEIILNETLAAQHPLRILLVEDNLINQKVALKLLGRLGYQADLAGNGIEALEALRHQTYDVVLMDIQMPEMDGDETTSHIRQEWDQNEQPYIIAMTAHALEGDREKYLKRGMDDYVSKPINVEALVKALKQVQVQE